MTTEVLTENMDALSSELIEMAFEGSPEARRELDSAEVRRPRFINDIVGSWEEGCYPALPASIRLLSTLACMPCLRTIAAGETHSRQTATQVYANYQHLNRSLLTTPSFSTKSLATYNVENPNQRVLQTTKGAISETAILGSLWWAIANGKRSTSAFALPAIMHEDFGKVLASGHRTGTDIKLYGNRRAEPFPIQVKSSNRNTRSYHPAIAVVTIEELKDEHGKRLSGPLCIVKHLISKNDACLSAINDQIDVKLEEAQINLARHEVQTRTTWQSQLAEIGARLFGPQPASIRS